MTRKYANHKRKGVINKILAMEKELNMTIIIRTILKEMNHET